MLVDIKKCNDTELWEMLRYISVVLDNKEPDKTSVIYFTWVRMFNIIRREIDKRMSVQY